MIFQKDDGTWWIKFERREHGPYTSKDEACEALCVLTLNL